VQKRFPDVDVMGKWSYSLKAIYAGEYKYILKSDGSGELYNVARDPEEKENVVGEHPRLATVLEEQLHAWTRKVEQERRSREGIRARVKGLKDSGRI
ncbi:MAG: hypothetical protein J7J88_03095, partial [Dehalococcoidia bacterium]|nr:hypothetical protein [Dehalococcoidia bacterium]